jgi:UDP-glucuronate 4-epimerase
VSGPTVAKLVKGFGNLIGVLGRVLLLPKLWASFVTDNQTRVKNHPLKRTSPMRYLVTGTAGFIGSHVSHRLLDRGDTVVGLDNVNDYYSVDLKRDRLARLAAKDNFEFVEMNIADRDAIPAFFAKNEFDVVINLAAQAGVRHSLSHPHVYIDSNILGFVNILEGCRHNGVKHLVYASSSSVYGANTTIPFSVHDNIDHPLSLYAASKKANELMAHTYSHLYGLPTTGLRFFTVYGPWGRPDMAMFLFADAILAGRPIDVFNNGDMKRDFTYIDDIVEGIIRVSDNTAASNPEWSGAKPDPATSSAPYKIYNIGNNQPVELMYLIEVLENCLGRKAEKNFLPMQPGDVGNTFADVDALIDDVGFKPATPIEVGVERFVKWYRDYHKR